MFKSKPRICSNCKFIDSCINYNDMINEKVSIDYSCKYYIRDVWYINWLYRVERFLKAIL